MYALCFLPLICCNDGLRSPFGSPLPTFPHPFDPGVWGGVSQRDCGEGAKGCGVYCLRIAPLHTTHTDAVLFSSYFFCFSFRIPIFSNTRNKHKVRACAVLDTSDTRRREEEIRRSDIDIIRSYPRIFSIFWGIS